eukprot:RCo026942
MLGECTLFLFSIQSWDIVQTVFSCFLHLWCDLFTTSDDLGFSFYPAVIFIFIFMLAPSLKCLVLSRFWGFASTQLFEEKGIENVHQPFCTHWVQAVPVGPSSTILSSACASHLTWALRHVLQPCRNGPRQPGLVWTSIPVLLVFRSECCGNPHCGWLVLVVCFKK